MKNIFVELRSGYSYLSKVEQAIADVILRDPQQFITSSTAKLAQAAGVSQGSINNFSRKFSSGGFSALKLRVAACIPEQKDEQFSVVDTEQGLKAAMEAKLRACCRAYENTLELNDEQNLRTAAELILAARRVQVFGVYYSGITANDLCYHLIQLGIPAAFVSDTLMCAVSATMLDETGLMIAVSASGKTKEIIEAVKIAKENGAPVICLTSDRFSPLAALSDAVLLTASSGISVADSADETRLAQHLVTDTLCAYIREKTETDDAHRFYQLREIANSHSVED